MSARWANWGWGGIVLAVITGAALELLADRAEKPAEQSKPKAAVETLLPADTVFYVRHDGGKQHAQAWEQTAAYEALSAIRVEELGQKLIQFLEQQSPGTVDPRLQKLITHLDDHGASFAVAIPKGGLPLPRATLVLHDAGEFRELLSEFGNVLLAENRIKAETREIENREVTVARLLKTPALDLAWWAEGGHLVIAVGVDPVQNVVAVLEGKRPNVTTHRLWPNEPTADKGRTITSTAWLDVAALRKTFNGFMIPIPEGQPISVRDALELFGLDGIEDLNVRSGYEGRALWSEVNLHAPGERAGLLSFLEAPPISLADLPPLPAHVHSFYAASVHPAKSYDTLLRLVREAAALGPAEGEKEVKGFLDSLPERLGFDPKADFLDALGSVVVLCDDPAQGFVGTGSTLIVQVKDADKLRKTFETIFQKLSELVPEEVAKDVFKVHRAKKHGREIWTLEVGQVVQGLGISVDEKWLVIGLMPQPVEAFFLRVDGKLPKWSPAQLEAAGAAKIPEKFSSLGVSNPRVIYHSLLKAAPFLASGLIGALKEEGVLPKNAILPWNLADLPPAELVVGPLFPNVLTTTSDETGIRWTSRSSLPSLPIVSGAGGGNGVLAGPMVVAFMLPAIQQARAAARRSQSQNNLKQLGLALHNYHDSYGSLPAGTVPNEKLKPADRLSFLTQLLPFVEQSALKDKIDFEGGWEDEANRETLQVRVPTFINPGVPERPNVKYAETHYVGIAGVGKDAPLLPVTSNRAGTFGYNRKTKIPDIKDGTSNTMMMAEAGRDFGAWGAGGTASIRSLTKQPYINGEDGIGGPFAGGCHVLMGDGSVKFISQAINAKTFEGIATINGKEVINPF